jgi:TolB-like protein|tara:strand:+ start:3782 stop:4393 length:612 start_codon:yes stop_codon:yes gene_type:complete
MRKAIKGARLGSRFAVVKTLLLGLIFLTGCAIPNYSDYRSPPPQLDSNLVASSHNAADELIVAIGDSIRRDKPLLAASFVDVNNLEKTTTFGRIVPQQFLSRFAQNGFSVMEMLLRKNIFIKEQGGEFLLSRAIKEIGESHDAEAVLVGVYAVGKKNVFVTAKVIGTKKGRVLASYDYGLPLGPDTQHLLEAGASPTYISSGN